MMKSAFASRVLVDWGPPGGREEVVAMDGCDLCVGLDADVGLVMDLLDEVLRHGLCQSGTADEHDDLGCVAGIEDGGLAG
jgi:hypothetical protein